LNWRQYFVSHKEWLVTIFVILIVSIVSFGTFNSTILSSDDWTFIAAKYAFGTLKPIDITDRRPLTLAFYYLLARLFGLHVEYYYVINFVILFLTALLVYAILLRVFPRFTWFASLVALVQLVYPVDYSRTWLIMSYIRFWWLINLCAIWMLLAYLETGSVWKLIVALIGIIVPLGAYEGQLGILLLTGGFITFLFLKTPIRRRLIVFGSILLASILFVGWRFFIQPRVLSVKDSYVESIQFIPTIIIERYIQGLEIFIQGWIIIIRNLFQSQWNAFKFPLIGLAILYIIACYIIFRILNKSESHENSTTSQRPSMVKFFLTLIPIGVAYWVAGYFPVIFLYGPVLQRNASRVNTYAVVGASIALVAAVAVLATFIAKSNFQIPYISVAILFPFIVAGGVFIQLQLNRENQIAWQTQKDIWNGVFDAIPNIKDGNKVVIIIPDYQHLKPLASLPFTAAWELDDGAKVLYNNPNIGGYYYYKDIQPTELLFTKNGFRPIHTDKIISYKRLIFVSYDLESRNVKLVENLEETLSLPFKAINYNPFENITQTKPSTNDFRWLVH
jgi:hypothetical protein